MIATRSTCASLLPTCFRRRSRFLTRNLTGANHNDSNSNTSLKLKNHNCNLDILTRKYHVELLLLFCCCCWCLPFVTHMSGIEWRSWLICQTTSSVVVSALYSFLFFIRNLEQQHNHHNQNCSLPMLTKKPWLNARRWWCAFLPRTLFRTHHPTASFKPIAKPNPKLYLFSTSTKFKG